MAAVETETRFERLARLAESNYRSPEAALIREAALAAVELAAENERLRVALYARLPAMGNRAYLAGVTRDEWIDRHLDAEEA